MLSSPTLVDFSIWLAGILLSPIVPYSGEAAGWWASGGIAYERQIRLAREKGEPVTRAEIDAFYPTSPEIERATKFWLEAIAEANEASDDERYDLVSGPRTAAQGKEPLSGDPLTSVRKYVATREREFELVRSASDAGAVARFPIDFGQQRLTSFHVRDLRKITNDLGLAIRVDLADGRVAAACDRIVLLLAVPQSVSTEPLLYAQLARAAMLGHAALLTREVLERTDSKQADLEKLQAAWDEIDLREPARRALIGERCAAVDATFEQQEAWDGPAPVANRWTPRMDAATTLTAYRRLLDAWRTDLQAARIASDRFERFKISLGEKPLLFQFFVASAVTDVLPLGPYFDEIARQQTHVDLTRLAIAVERYRLAEKGLPPRLDDLVPKYLSAVPKDPFSDGSIGYRKEGDAAVLWGVGPDRTNLGGVEPPNRWGLAGDIVVRIAPRLREAASP